ncbi:FCS-Like Zinc finger 8-like [Typha latifolia]|uniref:FCS-Like Zinc finger 8-like n=1 Tax=Typha latifolia TaxID=4733 RepID=UPI003C2FFB48
MVWKRSRAVGSKQGLIPNPSVSSPTGNQYKYRPTYLFPSSNLSVGLSDCGTAMSPTSTLEAKQLSSLGKPLFSDRNPRKLPWVNGNSKAIGLGLVDALETNELEEKSSYPETRMVLLGTQLKIQIPSVHVNSVSQVESLKSPIEFGVRNKDSQLAMLSPAQRSLFASENSVPEAVLSSRRVLSGCITEEEMELSEDYTCVICHGPKPRTIHIFDNCIIESHDDAFLALRKESMVTEDHGGCTSDNLLLGFCHACNKKLVKGNDIFMNRGEKAFCSSDCRYQEMLFDGEGAEESPESSPTL